MTHRGALSESHTAGVACLACVAMRNPWQVYPEFIPPTPNYSVPGPLAIAAYIGQPVCAPFE